MDLAFDHVFAFVGSEGREAEVLAAAGFAVRPPHRHRGQGTENRSVLFDSAYLELIYLASRAEAEHHELRLDRRAGFATTGHCPFGIGLRGVVVEAEQAAFVPYRPPWGTPGYPPMLLHRTSMERPGLPLVFVSQPWGTNTVESMKPGAWKTLDRAMLAHRNGASGIASVEVTVLDARGWPLTPPTPGVVVREGRAFHACVRLDGLRGAPIELAPWLTLAPA
jgi:hypothetical protein